MSNVITAKTASLYIVGTPIGNLQDMSPRANDVLKSCDLILAEDTRHSIHLLQNFAITTPMKSYHQHNENDRAHEVLELLNQGKKIALITDAGMPCISDPGYLLVKLAIDNDIKTTIIPGPCAVSSAIALSGIDCSKFRFEGFLSSKSLARQNALDLLKHETSAIILYEAPHRLLDTVLDIVHILGADRLISVVKEITKSYEQVFHGLAEEVSNNLANLQAIKGEYVIVISGAKNSINYSDQEIIQALDIMKAENISQKQAVKIVSKLYNQKKNYVYDLALRS